MITNLIRKALAPSIENILNEERTHLNDIISEMKVTLGDVKSIRARDIAANINTYDIAADISIDSYEIGRSIDVSDIDIDIDYSALGRHIVGNLDIDVSDINIDYSSLAREISDYVDLNEVNARINNLHNEVSAIGLKIHEIYAFIRKSTGQDMLDSEAQINGGAQ